MRSVPAAVHGSQPWARNVEGVVAMNASVRMVIGMLVRELCGRLNCGGVGGGGGVSGVRSPVLLPVVGSATESTSTHTRDAYAYTTRYGQPPEHTMAAMSSIFAQASLASRLSEAGSFGCGVGSQLENPRMVEPRECEHRHAIVPTLCAARACVFTPRCVRPDSHTGLAKSKSFLIN